MSTLKGGDISLYAAVGPYHIYGLQVIPAAAMEYQLGS
jgi:hypothetical protein